MYSNIYRRLCLEIESGKKYKCGNLCVRISTGMRWRRGGGDGKWIYPDDVHHTHRGILLYECKWSARCDDVDLAC